MGLLVLFVNQFVRFKLKICLRRWTITNFIKISYSRLVGCVIDTYGIVWIEMSYS